MPIPSEWRLTLPVIAAPQFLVSNVGYVVESALSGVAGCFPALNQKSTEGFRNWCQEIKSKLQSAPDAAPWGVNLIVHKTNARLEADADVVLEERPDFVITSLGLRPDIIEGVHSYGGQVIHDVISLRHARKAIGAGVDGLILVCAGAGGHAGIRSPFAFIPEIRAEFDGILVCAGGINDGASVRAAELLGADMVSMGTRFLATRESAAADRYKQLIIDSNGDDIVYTDQVSGVKANFIRASLEANDIDWQAGPSGGASYDSKRREKKAWKDVWSAGQGVAGIHDAPAIRTLVGRLVDEYRAAINQSVFPGIRDAG